MAISFISTDEIDSYHTLRHSNISSSLQDDLMYIAYLLHSQR
uniref:Uncharacterized protein n=1 Tax=viral metagenome TaxID=1070528 RepID=A0A6C0BKL0_9ZZZZ